MFSSIKMEEYIEFKFSGIFWVTVVTHEKYSAWDPFYAYEG